MPAGSTPSWAKGGGPIPKYVRVEKGDDFAGPSKPRLVYERPGERDLPILKVRLLPKVLRSSADLIRIVHLSVRISTSFGSSGTDDQLYYWAYWEQAHGD